MTTKEVFLKEYHRLRVTKEQGQLATGDEQMTQGLCSSFLLVV